MIVMNKMIKSIWNQLVENLIERYWEYKTRRLYDEIPYCIECLRRKIPRVGTPLN